MNGNRIVFRGAMVLGLAGTIASSIWWAAAFTQEVKMMQTQVDRNGKYGIDLSRDVFSLRERAAADDADDRATMKATENRLDSIDSTLRRIEGKIDNATREGPRQ